MSVPKVVSILPMTTHAAIKEYSPKPVPPSFRAARIMNNAIPTCVQRRARKSQAEVFTRCENIRELSAQADPRKRGNGLPEPVSEAGPQAVRAVQPVRGKWI